MKKEVDPNDGNQCENSSSHRNLIWYFYRSYTLRKSGRMYNFCASCPYYTHPREITCAKNISHQKPTAAECLSSAKCWRFQEIAKQYFNPNNKAQIAIY
jgi:hypothetical protein